MSAQLALTLIAASVGFIASVFFCIGNAMNTPSKILLQASPFYDFNAHLASSLAAQKAQYAVGALLLLSSFGLQIWAAQASAATLVNLPRYLDTWLEIVAVTLVPSGLLGALAAWLIYRRAMRIITTAEKARRLAGELEEEMNNQKRRKP